jgi:hypothetical protein
MAKRFIITESEKNKIRKMYGLIKEQAENPICDEGGCSGTYTGPEFQGGSDVAHQYSNTITKAVSNKLKELYKSGTYVKVDFNGIKLSTKGMGSGNVVYTVTIPFISVSDKCQAATGFAHVGGWGHTPELENRKNEILSYKPDGKNNTVVGNQLDVSPLTKTKENLQEYWIQWKHTDYQSECKGGQQQKAQTQSTNTQTTNNEQVSIKGSSLDDLRTKVKSQTQGLSIDTESANLDVNNLTVTFKKGDEKIQNLSVIWSNVSRDELNLVYQKVSKSNPSVEFLGDVKELNSGGTTVYCLLIAIY